MKTPIRILQDYLKEIVCAENACRLNKNTDDLKKVIEVKSQFIFAIRELERKFKIQKYYKEKYVDDTNFKMHSVRGRQLIKMDEQLIHKPNITSKDQRIKRLNFLNKSSWITQKI